MSRLALGSTQPPIQWVLGVFAGSKSDWGIKFTTFLHLLQRLRMSGFLTLLLLYAFMEQRGKILPLPFTEYVHDAWPKHISAMLS